MNVVPVHLQPAFFMSQAIKLGEKSRIISPPNPWVGCVIVKEGKIIARGSTEAFGGCHAEVQALKEAGENAKGSTVYVTLEPCPNYGKTPPCTEALIRARVKKVVIAVIDPDPKVRGQGIQKLREADIEVEVGLLKEKAKKSLLPYLYHRETGMSFCILKAAISIDGKIAAKDGTSLWITDEKARRDVHQIRAESQAVLVGTNTVLEDSPSLTVRYVQPPGLRPPLRVILDISGKIKAEGPLFNIHLAPTLIVTSEKCSQSKIEEWKNFGCEVKSLPLNESRDGIDLRALLFYLGERGILQLLIEGGSRLFSSVLKENLAQRFLVYVGGCLLGGEGLSLFSQLNVETIEDALRMDLIQMKRLGKDVRLDYSYKR